MMACAGSLALAACGGGSGSTSTGTTINAGLSSADATGVQTTYDNYQARIDSGALTPTSPTGQASMSGYIAAGGVGDTGQSTAIGDLSLDVNFDANSVGGTASNFGIYDGSGSTLTKTAGVSGTLDVAGTVSGSSLSANATGQLTDGTVPSDINVAMDGKFYDDNGTLLVQGKTSGTATPTDGSGSNTLSGGFFATKN